MQLAVVRIDDYGPWTLTLGHDREHELQVIQARLYASLQRAFAERGALVFQNRADELIAVTSGLGAAEHEAALGEAAAGPSGLRIVAAIGAGEGALEADAAAHAAMAGSEERRVRGEPRAGDDSVTILHLDVDGMSALRRTETPYEISLRMLRLHAAIAGHFAELGGMSFFMGGDNYMVVAGAGAQRRAAESFVEAQRAAGTRLNCGIGTGKTARRAAALATGSLDEIRRIRDSGASAPPVYELP